MKIEATIFQQLETRSSQNQTALPVASTKYHRAALDGYIDMLCDASKRDSNLPNELDGLTPTLLAAQSGHLDALRILVGRGGDPEKTALDGSSALHLAAARGHLNCVSFLVNFGVNMWSLDNDLHTAKDAAAIEQRKEILDFLDQMMAKQSALNTKNVQKLKEKAKVAADKRIKQLRKQQLKAIKQVEKDERYLVKLSHNRRLLKAAHSISDIKLVGRHQHQVLNPSNQPNPYLLAAEAAGTRTPGISSNCSSSQLSSSPSLANLISHKLQMDLIGRSAVGQTGLLSRRSVAGSTTTDESSAYSTSSVSSYLSAGSASPKRPARPKYSDLVAVNGAELARWQSKKPNQTVEQQQQSLKSSSTASTIGTKLWGLGGGVSRKVQLRRLLRAGAQSSSDLTSLQNHENSQVFRRSNEAPGDLNSERRKRIEDEEASGKLCNVQPAIKLKLKGASGEPDSGGGRKVGIQEQTHGANKWRPPSPTKMSRAISEPDFGVALRSATADDDCDYGREDDYDDNDNMAASTDTETKPPLALSIVDDDQIRIEDAAVKSASNSSSSSSKDQTPQQKQQSDSQSELLNQCLSQLKLRHEALTMRNQRDEFCESNEQLLKPSKLASMQTKGGAAVSGRRPEEGGKSAFGNSDELIQHQLSAGEFPLRPSLIKQKQQQQKLPEPKLNNQPNLNQRQLHGARETKISISTSTSIGTSADSIGSAGSFAKRNFRSSTSTSSNSAKSSSPTTSYISTPTTYDSSSSSSSSVETATNVMPAATCHNERLTCSPEPEHKQDLDHRPLPPSPPPLPPKTLSSATMIERSVKNHQTVTLRKPKQNYPAAALTTKRLIAASCGGQQTPTIELFLESNGLGDLCEVFGEEKIDLEALVLLTEEDLKSLNILLGPRRKLLRAIENEKRRQRETSNLRVVPEMNATTTTKPMYVMVDTQL